MNPEMRMIQPCRRAKTICALAIIFFCCSLIFAALSQRQAATAQAQPHSILRIQSSSFPNGGAIPRDYTCDGADLSPQLQWQSAPASTKSFAIVMDDPDAPIDFTHWLVYNIPPGLRELPQNASTHAAAHQGAAEGRNSFGRLGYGGPCPPAGTPHHYVFHLYALDARLGLPPGVAREQLESAMSQHILAEGQIVGIYQRATE